MTDLINSNTSFVVSFKQNFSDCVFITSFFMNSWKISVKNSVIIVKCSSVGWTYYLAKLIYQSQTIIISSFSPKYLYNKHSQKNLHFQTFTDSPRYAGMSSWRCIVFLIIKWLQRQYLLSDFFSTYLQVLTLCQILYFKLHSR